MDNQFQQPSQSSTSEGKTIAIVAYLTLIGFIIALVMNSDKKNKFSSFHIRQSLGIMLTGMVTGIVSWVPFIGIFIAGLVGMLVFVLWIIGIIGAVNEKEQPVPILGEMYQKWFSGI